MLFSRRCIACAYALIGRATCRSGIDNRSGASLRTRDFDQAAPDSISDEDLACKHAADPARAPRGVLSGLAIGIGLWSAVLAMIMALR